MRGVVGGLQQREGVQEVAGACSRAASACLSSSWRQEDDDWRRQEVGWASLLGLGRWAARLVGPGKLLLPLFLFCFCFLIF